LIDAFHLPALAHPATAVWSYGRAGQVEIRVAQMTPALLEEQVAALLAAGERELATRPVAQIVDAIDHVAGRLLDGGDPLRQAAEATIPAVAGASAAMVRRVLDGMAADWRAGPLRGLLRSELPDPEMLDGFRPRPGAAGRTRAYGPRLATHVFSGNVPGVAVTSLIRALLVKAPSLGKTAVGEPVLAPLFAQALAAADPGLGACLAVTYWPGGQADLERIALRHADAVIAYGGREAVAAVRERARPDARFLGYGHRVSFAVVAREALEGAQAESLARRAALDVALFDQQGCVSPHVFYVEEGGALAPAGWAALLADALAGVEAELPRGTLSPGEASAIRQLRGEAEFAQLAGRGLALHASPDGTAWTVVYDPDPTFAASCLNRTVRVKPVTDLEEVAARVEPLGAVLQSVGAAGPEERLRPLAERLGRLGASRIAPIGRMAWPPPAWHHDGHPPLRELVRWCDWEEEVAGRRSSVGGPSGASAVPDHHPRDGRPTTDDR
jgi:hypothetical protein